MRSGNHYSSFMSKPYIVTLKDSASDADTASVKLKVSELGGKIVDEFSLIKGFLVDLPASGAAFLLSHQHVATIEEDKEVKIQ